MNHTRGHETNRHRELKLLIAALLVKLGYDVLFEQKGCDVVGIKRRPDGSLFILGVEAQLNSKNICHNVRRNFASGVSAILIVTTSERLKGSITGKISRELTVC
jgi:hypothetical protein